jgi:hypothetical protein
VAVDYAQQAEKALPEGAPPAAQAAVLKTLAAALRKAGKADEAKEAAGRLAKVEESLDKEFAKEAVPFTPAPLPGRDGPGDRVVLVELFTGAQCPPCVAADVAFDALLKTAKPADVVLLQYHLHIPGPDPLTNPDSEKRAESYRPQGTPTFYIDGDEGPGVGGDRGEGKKGYEELVGALRRPREREAQAALKLTARRDGDKIAVHAEVSGLKKTGDSVRLRLVLVEDVARYAGSNGQRLHHHVVRAFPGGVEGTALKEASATKDAVVDLAELRKALAGYLDEHRFPEEDRPLELKRFKVVALVQNDATHQVLQAAQADVGAAE